MLDVDYVLSVLTILLNEVFWIYMFLILYSGAELYRIFENVVNSYLNMYNNHISNELLLINCVAV